MDGDFGEENTYSTLFSQSEDLFLKLKEEFTVPAFPVHHDVQQSVPDKAYLARIRSLLEQLLPLAPQVFKGLKYFFHPAEHLKLPFYQVYRVNGRSYLYLFKIDLNYRPGQGQVISQMTNDRTAEYRTRNLFIECDLIPLQEVLAKETPPGFLLEQNISQTWIGQTGKGYLVQGIWIDAELTKFFTRLFLPQGLRSYPYYPFTCRYKTICHTPIDLTVQGRKNHLMMLVRGYHFLVPRLSRIEEVMKKENFSEDLPLFRTIKNEIPSAWTDYWKNLKVTPFLNENDMKEYRVDFQ